MKGGILGLLAVVFAISATAGTATAAPSAAPSARVESIATVLFFGATTFEFDLYDCPPTVEMGVLAWDADQPDRPPGTGTSSGTQFFGPSTGDQVQHLTLLTGGNFLAGLSWVGSGFVVCGADVIPVAGSGTTKSVNGI